jgi:acyl transferase domain-containing protein/thioesterase domain-containing protein/acyl carrier protein
MTQEYSDSDIAIVGMAIRVPGALTPEAYWRNLCEGYEAVQYYSDEVLKARGVPEARLADPSYVKTGMPLAGFDEFDPEFFGFSPKEAAILDPQHRQFYEVAWEALERAGHPPSRFEGAVGVFAGCGMGAYFTFNLLTNPELVDQVGLFLLRHTGNDKDFLATRVSYAFDLKGPSVNVQTACSTSLVATHMAVQSLLSGECDLALAGGSTIEVPHQVGYEYKEGEVLSPDGHCRAFDRHSKGTVFGSGAGVVVLRRLADALEDGDHIHAIIKGSAINNDGSGKVGYLAPSVEGQAAAVAEALAVAELDADTITYVECHGTGTPVGDPIEIAALTKAFRETSERSGFCRIGSVKPSIGHLDTAAGVASLIKTALALEHGNIPPSLNYEAPNPAIEFDTSPFLVADKLLDWQPDDTPRRAGVNSLGVGGTNAFVILEQPPEPVTSTADSRPQLLVLSARSRKALDDAANQLADWLSNHRDQPLSDVAFTLMFGRHAFEHRRVLAAQTHDEAARLLNEGDARRVLTHTLELDRPSLVMMYPGGGAQYFQMSRGLYEQEPVFRDAMDRGLALLKDRHGVDLSQIYFAPDDSREQVTAELARTAIQLPLIFLVEYALTQLWFSYGVKPAALMGHSLGENTAACIAGVFSFEDALGLVLLRGQLMDDIDQGAMLSVNMPAADLLPYLGDALDLAASNSPQLAVASGPESKIDDLAARLASDGIDSQRVRVNIAAHSRMLDGILNRFHAYLASIELHAPTLPIISNRTGGWLSDDDAKSPDYWVSHLRNTIQFADGVNTLLEDRERVFLEVGPGNTLGSLVRQNPNAPAQRVFSSLRHPEDTVPDTTYFRTVIGRLWAVGIEPDLQRLWPGQQHRIPMPTYPFQHARYWIEPGAGQLHDLNTESRPLRQESFDQWFHAPRWVQQGVLESDETPCRWLVFLGLEPIAETLVEDLRDVGHEVVTVQHGDTYARLNKFSFTLAPEAGGAGYQELIDALVADELLPDRILHSWLITWDRSFRPGSTFFHRNQEHGFYSLFYLARALSKANATDNPMHWIVAGNGAQAVGEELLLHPDKATGLGPCAVIPREFPAITCSYVDLDLQTDDESQASSGRKRRDNSRSGHARRASEALAGELTAKAENTVIAWRDGVRWQRHLAPAAKTVQPLAGLPPRLRHRGVYLLTGGFGGISGVISDWLARTYQARLVLLSRTPLPQREEWDDWLSDHDTDDAISQAILRVRQLESSGGEVLPVTADVTIPEQVQDALTQTVERFGSLQGVFHTAGVIRDSLIALKSPRDIEDVLSAKVYGTLVLDEILANQSLDFLLLFSSTSTYIAPQGQIDYVAANAFLNAYAKARSRQRPYPIAAINWGIWKDVGMLNHDERVSRQVTGESEASQQSRHEEVLVHGTEHSTQYPLFLRRYVSRSGTSQQHLLLGELSDHAWMIDEHRLSNRQALLPGTGYLELIRAALAELGMSEAWQVANLLFQNPLYVDDGTVRAFRIYMEGSNNRFEVDVLAESADTGNWVRCASARVTEIESTSATVDLQGLATDIAGKMQSAGGDAALRTRQEDHLLFGPRWRVLKRLQTNSGQALAHLQVPSGYENDLADFSLHPGLLDIATGCAMDLIPGYADEEVSTNLWVPISYRQFRYHRPLQPAVVSHIRVGSSGDVENGFMSFDVRIYDTEGALLQEVDQLTLRRMEGSFNDVERTRVAQQVSADAVLLENGAPPKRQPSPSEQALLHNLSQGIKPQDGIKALDRLLRSDMPSEVIISSMDPKQLIRQAEYISSTSANQNDTRFARPELDSDFEAPRDDVEQALADLWGRLLGVEGIGVRDSFFDLGGHSLIAVRLFNEISDKYGTELPMSVLMQSPTIADLAELIRGEVQPNGGSETGSASHKPQFEFVVPMHTGPVADGTPLFVVSGMFGNVLNLSHLAHLLGEDRPFYALQARGLYGDVPPHESFEEMAQDYLTEIRQIQPKGPYLLGGFSGGGLIAYEMANQLIKAGEEIQLIIMLDTPVYRPPEFNLADKLSMMLQDIQRDGIDIVRKRIQAKREWREREADREALLTQQNGDNLSFQSERIGQAFRVAVARYQVPKLDVDVAVFRPKLDIHYRLSGNRLLKADRTFQSVDNGWSPFVRNLDVQEVPGNHDSMVLEPNVRVLVSKIRRAIQAVEQKPAS